MTSGPSSIEVQVWSRLIEAERIGICSHARPDGDAIGSQLALADLLWAQKKTVFLWNRHGVPETFQFLPGAAAVQSVERIPTDVDVLVFIECADPARAEINGWQRCSFLINIDHHVCNTYYADLNWVEPDAPCVGTMLYRMQQTLNLPASSAFYTTVYVALMTDTGNFQYNLKPETFRYAYELVARGAPAEVLVRQVYGTYPERRLRLLRMVLDTLQRTPDGRIAWIVVTRAMMEAVGAQYEDTEGFVDLPLKIRGVEVAVFFKEIEPGHFRISLRSNAQWDLLPFALRMGGGGHAKAAAFVMKGTLPEVQAQVIAEVQSFLLQAVSVPS